MDELLNRYDKHHEATAASLTDATREEMLAEVRDRLRQLHKGFRLYSEIVGPRVAAVHKDSIEELKSMWSEYSEDHIGLFEHKDYIDLVAEARATAMAQSSVLYRYSKGELKLFDQRQQDAVPPVSATRSASGCATWVFLWLGGTTLLLSSVARAINF